MGMNYYLHKNVCPLCRRSSEELHIGKGSAGWCFSLHVDPEEGLNSLEDWKSLWIAPGCEIRDEYGEVISPVVMLDRITNRSWERKEKPGGPYSSWEEFYRQNEAEPGPNGLIRHCISRYCVGHGDGTYDLIRGEFS